MPKGNEIDQVKYRKNIERLITQIETLNWERDIMPNVYSFGPCLIWTGSMDRRNRTPIVAHDHGHNIPVRLILGLLYEASLRPIERRYSTVTCALSPQGNLMKYGLTPDVSPLCYRECAPWLRRWGVRSGGKSSYEWPDNHYGHVGRAPHLPTTRTGRLSSQHHKRLNAMGKVMDSVVLCLVLHQGVHLTAPFSIEPASHNE